MLPTAWEAKTTIATIAIVPGASPCAGGRHRIGLDGAGLKHQVNRAK